MRMMLIECHGTCLLFMFKPINLIMAIFFVGICGIYISMHANFWWICLHYFKHVLWLPRFLLILLKKSCDSSSSFNKINSLWCNVMLKMCVHGSGTWLLDFDSASLQSSCSIEVKREVSSSLHYLVYLSFILSQSQHFLAKVCLHLLIDSLLSIIHACSVFSSSHSQHSSID